MAKPVIVKRVVKAAPLTYAEHDANFGNLQDATITLTAGSGGTAVVSDLNGVITLVAGTGVTLTGNNTAKTITITNSSPGGNTFGEIHVAGQSTVAADTTNDILTLVAGTNVTLTTNSSTDTITINGTASGTVQAGDQFHFAFYDLPNGNTRINNSPALSTDGSNNLFLGTNLNLSGHVITDAANADVGITPNGTGQLIVLGDMRIGTAAAGATVMSNFNNSTTFVRLKQRNSSGVGEIIVGNNNVEIISGSVTGQVVLNTPQAVAVGNGLVQSLITSAVPLLGTTDLKLAAGGGGSILLRTAANGNIDITPNGTGIVTVDGTNPVGFLDLPAVGTKSGSYTLAVPDVGKYVQVASGGSITIPNSTFAEGDIVLVVNNHTAAITITCSITDAFIAGTDVDKATVSLATRGVASILFLSGTRCIISGNVS